MTISLDRWNELFDIATGIADPQPLTDEEQQECAQIIETLDVFKASWVAPTSRIDAVKERFLEKLAVTDPDHPFLRHRHNQ